jgi:hypothetical protein
VSTDAAPAGSRIPPLFERLIDDAAVFPPGNASIPDALTAHTGHRAAWYAELVGPLLLPASALTRLGGAALPRIGVIGDTGLAGVHPAFEAARSSERSSEASDAVGGPASERWTQFEVAVAKRGEDPQPGLRRLLGEVGMGPDIDVYAELPLTWGLLDALDTLSSERAGGARVAPKFRAGGLAAELFPTPIELAAVICACRDRELPFKLTAGLHHATRHTDPETGFTHHGFLNVLAASLAAADGTEVADVAELLGSTDPVPIVEVVRVRLADQRPLWIGFGSCSIDEPLADLATLGLLGGEDR